MSYGRLPDTAPTPLQTIADLQRRIHRLEQSLADALVDADAWHARAQRMDQLVAGATSAVRVVVDDLAHARKVWEEAT